MNLELIKKKDSLDENFSAKSIENKSKLFVLFFFLATISLGFFLFHIHFSNIFFPNTFIDEIDVSYLNQEQALSKIAEESIQRENSLITLNVDELSISTDSASLGIQKDINSTVTDTFINSRSSNVFYTVKNFLQSLNTSKSVYSPLIYDLESMNSFVKKLNDQVFILGTQPSATLGIAHVSKTLEINPGKIGREIDTEKTKENILKSFEQGKFNSKAIVASTAAELTPDEIVESREYASTFIGYDFEFTGPDHIKKTLTDQDIISLLALPSGLNQDAVDQLVSEWEEEINRDSINAEFEYDQETQRVTTFVPDRPGLAIKTQELSEKIHATIGELALHQELQAYKKLNGEQTVEFPSDNIRAIPVITTLPDITLADTNNMGINERIGYGDSEYDHSIPNRIHNVAHTASKITNTIVAPGEEFSFTKTLGDVSRATGFKSAYVIKGGKTILGDGGGVCQVSTTLFRSLLDSGLEITRRIPHSYRVSYYELDQKPGIDATVYSGNVDLRFKNDTNHHVLIHTGADSENLTMFVELYGTSDGRTTEIKDHTTYGYRPPLPPEYADDPSLPPGALKQVDWAAAGISAKFTHIIKDKDGNVLNEEEYVSNYRPWAAKFLRGI